ncbi:MAG: hypothetical protein ACREGA_01920 [Candidatus Saccharimonadales bacterium]
MPLASFAEVPQVIEPVYEPVYEVSFRKGTPDVSEAAGVADQAMYELGLAWLARIGTKTWKKLRPTLTD